MKIAIVDDDPAQLAQLSQYISEELIACGDYEHEITKYSSGEHFLKNWHPGMYNLIVLDIFMGTLTGIDVAYKIREQDEHVFLAFCTSSNEFASESYDVGAQNYLRKPITSDSIRKMIRKLNLRHAEKLRTIRFPDGHITVLRNILYTEYSNHVITIYTSHEPAHRLRITQTELESILIPTGHFCSPYKGITVNFYAVKTLTESDITLIDGTIIPVTRRKAKDTREAYQKFRFNQMRKELST